MATLLAISQGALRLMGRYSVPAAIVGNTDPTAVRCLALANDVGKTLALDYSWQVLLDTHTFATVNGTADYALPTGFNRLANLSVWNRTNNTPLSGPMNAIDWQELQSSAVSVGGPFNQRFRIAGNLFSISPTPTAAETIAFDFYTNYWIVGKQGFMLDVDEPLIDSDLIQSGLLWRLLDQLGDDSSGAEMRYKRRLESLQARDGARDVIRMSPRTYDPNAGLPDTGFGL